LINVKDGQFTKLNENLSIAEIFYIEAKCIKAELS